MKVSFIGHLTKKSIGLDSIRYPIVCTGLKSLIVTCVPNLALWFLQGTAVTYALYTRLDIWWNLIRWIFSSDIRWSWLSSVLPTHHWLKIRPCPTRWRKTQRRAEKNEVQCFRVCVDLILSMHGFLTDGFPHRLCFFNHKKNLKQVLFFFIDG